MDKKQFLNKEFLKQFKTETQLTDFFKELHSEALEHILQAEMDNHLGYEKNAKSGDNTGNSRNGFSNKNIKTEYGEHTVSIPRDRQGDFEPIIVPKGENKSLSVENMVISLYSKGMSNSDIEQQLQELYGFKLSTSAISHITNKVLLHIQEWQTRPLERLYFVVWMDGIVFKVRDNGKVINKTIYLAVGLNMQGKKELLGMWLGENESASFWMSVLTDLKERGVEDILVTVTDNLTGFTDGIKTIYPKSDTQICVVHQIRNSCKYVVWKDKKAFTSDLKNIYKAINKKQAKIALEEFRITWGTKYPYAVKSWDNNWENLTVFFSFPVEIRKIIYTTNLIENLNGKIRKYTKNRMAFPTDDAVQKAVYLALKHVTNKWTQPIHNWAIIINQFITMFEDRIKH
jgi:transposase-like protein